MISSLSGKPGGKALCHVCRGRFEEEFMISQPLFSSRACVYHLRKAEAKLSSRRLSRAELWAGTGLWGRVGSRGRGSVVRSGGSPGSGAAQAGGGVSGAQHSFCKLNCFTLIRVEFQSSNVISNHPAGKNSTLLPRQGLCVAETHFPRNPTPPRILTGVFQGKSRWDLNLVHGFGL